MNRVAQQKIKLLYLWELLKRESGESHPMKTGEILHALEEVGISCDRRTLARDISDLNEWGFEVMSVLCGHKKAYYVEDRLFSMPEIRFLMDAAEGSEMITDRKAREMREKLASMGGRSESRKLESHSLIHNGRKHSNEVIYYSMDTIENAIWNNKKISFFYFRLNEKREKVYEREKFRFVVDPIGLSMNGNRHYLSAIDPCRKGVTVFRIDRMEAVMQEAEDRSLPEQELKAMAEEYAGQTVKMYAGKSCEVTLRFVADMIPSIMDRFGEQVEIRTVEKGFFEITVPVMISPTFWGWLFQYQDRICLTHPPEVIREAREFIEKLPYCKEEPK